MSDVTNAGADACGGLSSQARWYLGGVFPMPVDGTHGNRRPEPTAMGELIAKGLVCVHKGAFGDSYALTKDGVIARHAYLAGSACREGADGCCTACGVSMVECDGCHGIGYHHDACAEVA